jgi:hypothetical protein
LCHTKRRRRYEKTPETTPIQLFDENVRANTAEQSATEAAKRNYADVDILAPLNERVFHGVIVMLPERLSIVSNVAGPN